MTGGGQLCIVGILAEVDAAGLHEGDDGGGGGLRVVHHVRDGLTDDVVQRQQDDERDKRPQAAAAHRDALFLVQLLDSQLIFLLVVAVLRLERLDLRRQAGHFEHALLALHRHRQQHELDDEGEEDQRQAVVVREHVQPVEQIAERHADDVGQARGVFGLRSGSFRGGSRLHADVLVVRGADVCGRAADHGQKQHGGKDPNQDFFLHCFPPNVVGWPRTTGKNHAALWHRVKIVSLVKGITPQQPFERQPAALHHAVLLDRLQGILRAGRRKPAPARQARGDILLVQADEPQAYPLHAVCPPRRPSFAASER